MLEPHYNPAINDYGKKKAECVAWQDCSEVTEPIEVDLWVLECLVDPSPGKLLILGSVTIIFELCENVFPFLWSEEFGSYGIVMDEEVHSN